MELGSKGGGKDGQDNSGDGLCGLWLSDAAGGVPPLIPATQASVVLFLATPPPALPASVTLHLGA